LQCGAANFHFFQQLVAKVDYYYGLGGTGKPIRVEADPKSLAAKVSSISLSALTSIE